MQLHMHRSAGNKIKLAPEKYSGKWIPTLLMVGKLSCFLSVYIIFTALRDFLAADPAVLVHV